VLVYDKLVNNDAKNQEEVINNEQVNNNKEAEAQEERL